MKIQPAAKDPALLLALMASPERRTTKRAHIVNPISWRAIVTAWNSKRFTILRDAGDTESFAAWVFAAFRLYKKEEQARNPLRRLARHIGRIGIDDGADERATALASATVALRERAANSVATSSWDDIALPRQELTTLVESATSDIVFISGAYRVCVSRADLKKLLAATRRFDSTDFRIRRNFDRSNPLDYLQLVASWRTGGRRGGFRFANQTELANSNCVEVALWVALAEQVASPVAADAEITESLEVAAALAEHVAVREYAMGAESANVAHQLGHFAAMYFEKEWASFLAKSSARTSPSEVFAESFAEIQSSGEFHAWLESQYPVPETAVAEVVVETVVVNAACASRVQSSVGVRAISNALIPALRDPSKAAALRAVLGDDAYERAMMGLRRQDEASGVKPAVSQTAVAA